MLMRKFRALYGRRLLWDIRIFSIDILTLKKRKFENFRSEMAYLAKGVTHTQFKPTLGFVLAGDWTSRGFDDFVRQATPGQR